jgi:single-strand DNA-binding protein
MLNKSILIGRLTRDVEVKYTQNNKAVASFTLAVNRKYSKEGEQQADFIPIVTWGKSAEFASKYFKKGMQVSIVGRIETRSWDDQNGQKRYATEVIAEELGFAEGRKSENVAVENTNEFSTITDDDLPF